LDQKVGALVWSPLGWGRLTGKIRRGQPLPEVSRLHKTAHMGPQVSDEHLYKVVDALDAWPPKRQDRSPGGAELAVAAAHGFVGHHRRADRGAVAAEPGSGGLESDRRAGGRAG
jgi:aryl-alcohol dehydrogenase-like predicted oxidoreductase